MSWSFVGAGSPAKVIDLVKSQQPYERQDEISKNSEKAAKDLIVSELSVYDKDVLVNVSAFGHNSGPGGSNSLRLTIETLPIHRP